jgi:hypothetical protein
MPSGRNFDSQFRIARGMRGPEQRATGGMIRLVLTIFVVAIIVAVACLAFFTPGQSVP